MPPWTHPLFMCFPKDSCCISMAFFPTSLNRPLRNSYCCEPPGNLTLDKGSNTDSPRCCQLFFSQCHVWGAAIAIALRHLPYLLQINTTHKELHVQRQWQTFKSANVMLNCLNTTYHPTVVTYLVKSDETVTQTSYVVVNVTAKGTKYCSMIDFSCAAHNHTSGPSTC